MAQYKVPQDVEADDKLLGPFSFRQFVYLMIAGGCIALAIAFFQIFPLLVIIPLPIALFFIVLALPLKKDQPMETYLAAIVTYYLKPHTRLWKPGQKETTIDITAPKIQDDDSRARDITGEEATHRLSFLADIVDTEGQAIKSVTNTQVNEDLVVEANMTSDMFETRHFENLENTIAKDENARHEEVIKEMREAIMQAESVTGSAVQKHDDNTAKDVGGAQDFYALAEMKAKQPTMGEVVEKSNSAEPEKKVEEAPKASIIELANNTDFSIATIAKEADRINRKEKGEVFISLH